jgi:Ser/Thr protein kinase RdoA (MazF antagonist)
MRLDAALPAELQQWVTRRLGGLAATTDVSWPRGDSRVWRVASNTGEAYIKLSPTPQDYAREVHAYQHAASALAADEAPRLLAADPGLQAIMTTPLPGQIVRGLSLPAATEARVHELAGRLLRRWHDHPDPAPAQVRESVMASMAEQAKEATACLEPTAEHLTDAQRALVQEVSRDLPGLAESLPLVFRHGDYSPRNWLWDTERGTHGLIDFEKAAHGLAVEDLVWLYGAVWPTRPDLKTAFLTGYGRELSGTEQRALPLLTARLAVSYLNTGLIKQQPVLLDRGRGVLSDLTRASG